MCTWWLRLGGPALQIFRNLRGADSWESRRNPAAAIKYYYIFVSMCTYIYTVHVYIYIYIYAKVAEHHTERLRKTSPLAAIRRSQYHILFYSYIYKCNFQPDTICTWWLRLCGPALQIFQNLRGADSWESRRSPAAAIKYIVVAMWTYIYTRTYK